MAEFIGGLGGLLMIVLIVVLFFRFLIDVGVDKEGIYRKQIAGFALPALLLALLQLVFGALVNNFAYDAVSVFDINSIWTIKPVSETQKLVTSYSASYILEQGVMPLYYVITGVFAGVLYEMYDQCALYISILSGIVTYVALGMTIARSNSGTDNGDRTTQQMFMMLLCLPGSVFLFLPSGFALCIALLSVFIYVWKAGEGNRVISLILAVLCVLSHLVGICALLVYVAGVLIKTDKERADIRDLAAIIAGQLIVIVICVANGWGSLPEFLIVFAIAAILGINSIKVRINHSVATMINLMLVLVSGFWLTGILYGVM